MSSRLAVAAIAAVLGGCSESRLLPPPATLGPPLRSGDRVFLLTAQLKPVFTLRRGSNSPSDLLIDLWSFDAATARPVWRRRMQTQRSGEISAGSLLGAEGNTLWLKLPRGIAAASASDGSLLADAAAIEAANPQLKGLLPSDSRYFQFDSTGLTVTAADARRWRLHASTWKATPAAGSPQPDPEIRLPAYFTPNHTPSFQERGLEIPGHWLGFLTTEEAQQLAERHVLSDLWGEFRRSLFAAQTEGGRYRNVRALGPEFLTPGLLSAPQPDGRSTPPLWRRNPDSIFVLHRDRLGEQGRLRLSRIAGPEGRVLWEAALPLSVLQSVLPGEAAVVLFGVEFTPPADNRPRDPMHTARDKLVAVDLASGRIAVHDQSDTGSHPEAFLPPEAGR